MALTATATESVRSDILKQLDIEHDHLLFISSFNRPNLDYQVRFHNTDRYADVKETIQLENAESKRLYGKPAACGIIYCGTRESCESLATRLQGDGIKALAYHAGLHNNLRTALLKAWTNGTTETVPKKRGEDASKPDETVACDIVIATVAFGMGIDKKDVRFVLHWDLAQSMEAYYQQAGRAGRDGLRSKCILYYSQDDKERIIFLISKSANEQQQKGWKANSFGSAAKDSSSKNAMKAFEDVSIQPHIIWGYPRWSMRLPDGTWVNFANANKRKEPAQDREISMVDDCGGDGFDRPFKRALFTEEDEDDIVDDEEEKKPSSSSSGFGYKGYSGFKTASGKSMDDAQDLRMKLFGKPNVASTSTANLNQSSTRFPQLFVPPRHVLIRDLPLADRENYFARILTLAEKKLGDENKDLALRIVAALENWCYIRSKNQSTYKMYIGTRMREVAAPAFGLTGNGGNTLSIACTILEEERKKVK
ncbi:UNVERIFIED_CONTAM: ATP-dependent DNA helicase Q5 [Siphonaria sp. JEL0065]|nr:ATP-dependent DNA helicase Q5 [Siphonaria sp. JEL0065]